MAWIRKKIKIRKSAGPAERELIAGEIIDFIVSRTKSGKKIDGESSFPGYSDSYKNSKKFKSAGKSKNLVNLTLSNEMLQALTLLNHKKGEVTIGFKKGDDRNNGVAEGNIKGTYGQKTPIRGKKRDFLGIKASDKKKIQDELGVK